MTWLRAVRFTVLLAVGLLFLISLAAIVFTGPIIVRPEPRELDLTISTQRLRADVESLCSRFFPRDFRHTENLDAAAIWIGEQLADAGMAVDVQDYDLREGRFRNVIGSREGTNTAAGVIVVGAHYDAYREYAGADDNASGVAVLLELARSLRDVPLEKSVYFVAFSTEEPPYFDSEEMGSHVFARRLLDEGVRVDLMLALDCVGFYSDMPKTQRFPLPGMTLFYPGEGNFLAVVGDLGAGQWIKQVKQGLMTTEGGPPVHSFRAPSSFAGVHFSDHMSFRKLGLPGVMLTDTAFMRSPHYHTGTDTPDTLDYERMAQVVRALHGFLRDGNSGF